MSRARLQGVLHTSEVSAMLFAVIVASFELSDLLLLALKLIF